ncbi:MAG TPA: nuclear transport factor 2 family protein [Longimicrobium sp.]
MTRHITRPLLVLLALVALLPGAVAAQAANATRMESATALDERAGAFLRAVRRKNADGIAVFFPRTGDWSYVHTAHHEDGRHVGIRRFSGPDALSAIQSGGPLRQSFTINYESQPIGLFAHQVMHRGTAWRRVRSNRFVPPGAPASSPTFVEWRREGGEWVISAFGDESFPSGKTPPWCC